MGGGSSVAPKKGGKQRSSNGKEGHVVLKEMRERDRTKRKNQQLNNLKERKEHNMNMSESDKETAYTQSKQ